MHILIEFLKRRNPKDVVIQDKFEYPGAVIIKSGQRSNTAAKVILPAVTTIFLAIYCIASNINLQMKN